MKKCWSSLLRQCFLIIITDLTVVSLGHIFQCMIIVEEAWRVSLLQAEGCSLTSPTAEEPAAVWCRINGVAILPGYSRTLAIASSTSQTAFLSMGYWSVTTMSPRKLLLCLAEFPYIHPKASVWWSWTPKECKMWQLQLITLELTLNGLLSAVAKTVVIVVTRYHALSRKCYVVLPLLYCRPTQNDGTVSYWKDGSSVLKRFMHVMAMETGCWWNWRYAMTPLVTMMLTEQQTNQDNGIGAEDFQDMQWVPWKLLTPKMLGTRVPDVFQFAYQVNGSVEGAVSLGLHHTL